MTDDHDLGNAGSSVAMGLEIGKGLEALRDQNEALFLDALARITEEYGVAVSGCGCCNSPYLAHTPKEPGMYSQDLEGYIEWRTGDEISEFYFSNLVREMHRAAKEAIEVKEAREFVQSLPGVKGMRK